MSRKYPISLSFYNAKKNIIAVNCAGHGMELIVSNDVNIQRKLISSMRLDCFVTRDLSWSTSFDHHLYIISIVMMPFVSSTFDKFSFLLLSLVIPLFSTVFLFVHICWVNSIFCTCLENFNLTCR